MKVYINRHVVNGPWGGGNLFTAAYRHHSERASVKVINDDSMRTHPDVMLLVGLDNASPGEISVEQAIMHKMFYPECQLVLRVNENDARKGTRTMDDKLLMMSKHVDATVFVSSWLQDYFNEKGWACQKQTVIINGVDKDVFKPQPKLDNGKLNIVAHHWSDNRMKGADVYEALDVFVGQNPDEYAFTYVGRHRCDFKHTHVIKPISGAALGRELGKHDVYVSASRWDPGPNHILEALACGLPTYVHSDGGGCVEFAGQANAYLDFDQLKQDLVAARAGSIKHPHIGVTLSTWQACVQEYNAFLETVCRESQSGSQNS